jgi:hypothetical protein
MAEAPVPSPSGSDTANVSAQYQHYQWIHMQDVPEHRIRFRDFLERQASTLCRKTRKCILCNALSRAPEYQHAHTRIADLVVLFKARAPNFGNLEKEPSPEEDFKQWFKFFEVHTALRKEVSHMGARLIPASELKATLQGEGSLNVWYIELSRDVAKGPWFRAWEDAGNTS